MITVFLSSFKATMDSISSQPCILQPHESSSLTKMNSDKSLTQEPQQIETKQLSPNFPRRNRIPFEYVSILPPPLEDADSNDLIVELSPKSLEFKLAYQKILSSVSKCFDEYRSVNLTFELLGIEKVNNASLSQRFARCQQYLSDRGASTHVLTAFHGTRQHNITRICMNGLLPIGHPSNPSSTLGDDYFGDPRYHNIT